MKDKIKSISKELKLSHIGSNISILPILEEIYEKKKDGDIVILDNAHAHLTHLIVKDGIDENNYPVEDLIEEYGIHCDRAAGCDASGGSLGHGLGIGIGYAQADKNRQVYVTVSDGSMMEGSNWEALRIANDLELTNLHIYGNFNGYSAVAKVNTHQLVKAMMSFFPYITPFYTKNGEGFEGIQGHYKTL